MTGSEIERSRGHPPLEIDENNNKKIQLHLWVCRWLMLCQKKLVFDILLYSEVVSC